MRSLPEDLMLVRQIRSVGLSQDFVERYHGHRNFSFFGFVNMDRFLKAVRFFYPKMLIEKKKEFQKK